jgi:hypothetical protein
MIKDLIINAVTAGIDVSISEESDMITIKWNSSCAHAVAAVIEASLTEDYAVDTFDNAKGLAVLTTKRAIIQRHEDRTVSVKEVLKLQASGVVDPCVYCGESTAFGAGRFVNRIPADRQCYSSGAGVDGYACNECMTPPFCEECGVNPPNDDHFRCEQCEETHRLEEDMADA